MSSERSRVNLSLFEEAAPAPPTGTCVLCGHFIEAGQRVVPHGDLHVVHEACVEAAATPPPRDPKPGDVCRRVEHAHGPFHHLRAMTLSERADPSTTAAALVDGSYRVIELVDGRVFCEFTGTGERRAHRHVTPEVIEQRLREGLWREVEDGG